VDTRCSCCGDADHSEANPILLCDGKAHALDEVGFHLQCLSPPLARVPKGDWFCPDCVKSKQRSKPSRKVSAIATTTKCKAANPSSKKRKTPPALASESRLAGKKARPDKREPAAPKPASRPQPCKRKAGASSAAKPPASADSAPAGSGPELADVMCEVCQSKADGESMLLCDGVHDAEVGYHMHCLSPPLKKAPKGQWFCPRCTMPATDVGERPSPSDADDARCRKDRKAKSEKGKASSSSAAPVPSSEADPITLNHKETGTSGGETSVQERRGGGATGPVTGEEGGAAWSAAQVAALHQAQARTEPTVGNYWHEIARGVAGKSADQCFEKFFGRSPEAPAKRRARATEAPSTSSAQADCLGAGFPAEARTGAAASSLLNIGSDTRRDEDGGTKGDGDSWGVSLLGAVKRDPRKATTQAARRQQAREMRLECRRQEADHFQTAAQVFDFSRACLPEPGDNVTSDDLDTGMLESMLDVEPTVPPSAAGPHESLEQRRQEMEKQAAEQRKKDKYIESIMRRKPRPGATSVADSATAGTNKNRGHLSGTKRPAAGGFDALFGPGKGAGRAGTSAVVRALMECNKSDEDVDEEEEQDTYFSDTGSESD